jgi:hypothetical protein
MFRHPIALGLALAMMGAGCSTTASRQRAEPPFVAIHNATGQDLESVTVREAPDDHHQARRLGSVAPLLKDAVYSIRRQPNPQPLSDRVMVMWTARGGRSETAVVTIDGALSEAKGMANEALIFHILPGAQVLVSIELLHN